jgi:spermidine synthase
MYNAIGTGLTAILLYSISYIFCRINIFSLQFHRRLWNIILAGTFVLTALAGIFLALQINYKWDIPVIKSILKWHVEMGTGLSVTGFLHLFRHFSYFTKRAERQEKIVSPILLDIKKTSPDISANLFIIGFVSSSVQLLLLREIMNITGGYELIAGAFLCSWLIGSAAGSILAPGSSLTDIRKINLMFSTGPLLSVILMLILSRLFLKTGETPSFLSGIVFTLLVLLPFCLISGFTFIKLVSAGKAMNFIPGRSFSIETAGGIAAGITISLLSAGILNTYQSLLVIITLGISYTVLTFYITGKNQKLVFKVSVLILSAIIIIFSPDIFFRQLLLKGIRVTETEDTPYGNLTKGKYHTDTSLYYNQRLLIYSNDAIESEEDVHYGLLQAESTDNILLISGPVESRMKEIMKYDAKRVVYVERDPALSKTAIMADHEVSMIPEVENDDAFSYVRKTNEKFDAVIMLLPPPSSLLLNRFYTIEFFSAVKDRMNNNGIFSCSPGINPIYFNRESVKLYSSVFNSLKAVFKNVIPIAGNKLYFIASDKYLSTAICSMVSRKDLNNLYVGPGYLSDDIIASKSDEVLALMDSKIKYNRSTRPIACFYYQTFSLSKNLNEKIPTIILLVLLFAFSLRNFRPENAIMYFSASALAGYEIILLLILQLTIGNMYQIAGLIIAGIMAGLAVGSGIRIPLPDKKKVIIKILLLTFLYAVAGFSIDRIMEIERHFMLTVLLILSGFLPALITGSFFRDLTSGQTTDSDSSRVYSADLSGSALGFIVFSGLAIPLLGIGMSLLILPVLILAGFLLKSISRKR